MSDMVKIEDTEMLIREYKGQRVVTFRDIDEVHQRPSGTASRNFRKNKKHFIEEVDYIRRNSSEAKEEYGITAPNGMILMTESGYLMIVKSFTDDLSWQVQRQLVNTYFKVKEQQEIKPEDTAKPEPLTEFPNYPAPVFQTSSTPVPKNPNWYTRNRRRMEHLCKEANAPLTTLYHHILLRVGEEYDLNSANAIYLQETGHVPRYSLDIISYFPDLAKLADDYLDRLEKITYK